MINRKQVHGINCPTEIHPYQNRNILAIMNNDMLFVGISAPKSSWHNWMIAILMSFIIQ
jgi:hypothetical protein